MKSRTQKIRFALALAGVDVKRVSLNLGNLVCRDPDYLPEYHDHKNGCSWSIVDSSTGIVERTGRVTNAGRVTEFKGGNQQVLPFGGSFKSDLETLYQFRRWSMFDGQG